MGEGEVGGASRAEKCPPLAHPATSTYEAKGGYPSQVGQVLGPEYEETGVQGNWGHEKSLPASEISMAIREKKTRERAIYEG